MNGLSLKNISKIAFILAAFVSVGFLCISKPTAFFGVWVGSLWMFLNIFFLFHLLNIALNFNFKKKNQIFLPLIFKFPMLYVAGFFILRSRLFPVYSLLLGLTLFMLALMIQWLRTRSQGKSLASLLFLMAWPVLAHAEESSFDSLNFVRLTTEILGHTPFSEFLHRFENVIFGVIIISLLTAVFYFMSRAAKLIPGRLQSAGELLVEALDNFVCGILGPRGKKYTPFLGTLFIYIWTMNMIGLVPLMKSPTGNSMLLTAGGITLPIPTTTMALALLVFVYVQFIGIKEQGILGYLDHMAGTPRDIFGYALMPLMFVMHVIGEFAKPLSLAFRLYGNILGEDVLLAVFMGLGIGACAFLPIPMAAPIHFPFIMLAMATGTIQAFVFTLLSTVYIARMLPHEHPKEHHAVSHN